MNSPRITRIGRAAAIAMFAMALVATGCGTTKSNVLAPGNAGAQQGSASDPGVTGAAGGNYITADDQYGIAIRQSSPTATPSKDAPVCASTDLQCLEP